MPAMSGVFSPGLGLLLCSEGLLLLAGDHILRDVILKDYEIRNRIVRLLFALTFASTCALSEAVIFAIVEVFSSG